ncbi:geranylgeranyl transferase type-2 subunit alpha [Phlebotomus argentipes]|uniref:geranylgeranyl transferase type-2 subunit alpha n=1 Tax=Phlebotomus argentipes TaxID=94469 RepID=UPI002892C783|nr:geranylgeranyl transferase type-2 subunit alpha [Phlebotomus argentipes]
MHGRLKVRTTEEEAARKKVEQQEKLKAYKEAMARIQEKRTANELDKEMLELTRKLLSSNPDIYTLWNIRKECFQVMRESLGEEELKDLHKGDLLFTEQCLQVNPKSYGAWHHRGWILETRPDPDWKRELELCTRYLKLDERNFLCWNYRRYVAGKAGATPESELAFCTQKIQHNFSNYSSWHYRSKLLPGLFPHETDHERPISEEKLRSELELVLTAAFTDPKDSSAWFYQRWLLGHSELPLDLAAYRQQDDFATVAFTKAVNLHNCQLSGGISGWKSASGSVYDTTWTRQQTENPGNELVFTDDAQKEYRMEIKSVGKVFVGVKLPKFGHIFGSVVLDHLKEQLDSCNQLLEFEPDSKWTLLTAALLMRAIDRKAYHARALEFLRKLQLVDTLRSGYYDDLASKWAAEQVIEKWIEEGDFDAPIDLSAIRITTIPYEQFMSVATEVNLEGNQLTDKNLAKLVALQNCKVINLKDNRVSQEAVEALRGKLRDITILVD